MNTITLATFYHDVNNNTPANLFVKGWVLGPSEVSAILKSGYWVSAASTRALNTTLADTSWHPSRFEFCGKPVFEVAIDALALHPDDVHMRDFNPAAKHNFASIIGLALEDLATGFTYYVYHKATDPALAKFGVSLSAIIGYVSPHHAPLAVDINFKDRLAAAKIAEADTLAVLNSGNTTKRRIEPHGYPSRDSE